MVVVLFLLKYFMFVCLLLYCLFFFVIVILLVGCVSVFGKVFVLFLFNVLYGEFDIVSKGYENVLW